MCSYSKPNFLALICEIWELYPNRVEEDDNLPNQILTVVKRAVREKSRILQLTALTLLFRLLENFAAERNPYAPIIYKTLTFSFIENHSNIDVREYIMHNFCTIFQRSHSIPVSIVIEPLIKQLQKADMSSYSLNVFDFTFFNVIAAHSRLSLKNAIQFLDVLAKIYLNDVTFAHSAMPPIIKIVSRFIEEDSMQEYVQKLSKIALAMYYSSVKKRKSKDINIKKFIYLQEKDELFAGPNTLTPEMEQEILNAQKRALIIEILKSFINMHSEGLNARLKALLVHTNKQIKLYTRFDNKGIKYLLAIFGDPDEIIREFENEVSHDVNLYVKPIDINYADLGPSQQQSTDMNPGSGLLSVQDTYKSQRDDLNEQSYKPLKLDSNGYEYEDNNQDDSTPQHKENHRYSPPPEKQSANNISVALGSVQTKEMLFQNFMESQSLQSERTQTNKDAMEAIKAQNKKIGVKNSRKKKGDSSFWSDKEPNVNPSRAQSNAIAHLKALEKIDELQRKNDEKRLAKKLLEEYKQKKELRTKSALRKQIDERRIELGVEAKMSKKGDITGADFLMKNKDKIEDNGAKNQNKINIVYLDEEEESQREAVSCVLKQNIKAFRFLFAKYNSSVNDFKRMKSFDAIQMKQWKLNHAETWKLIKDNGLSSFVSKEEMIELVRLVNKELMHSKDYKAMEYEGFVKFLFQLAVLAFSRPPIDMMHLPYVEQLNMLCKYLYNAAKDRGEHRHMFEDVTVDALTEDERDKLRELNDKINDEPMMALPSGFKKVMENNVKFTYEASYRMPVPQKYKLCYDIVNSILQDAFE